MGAGRRLLFQEVPEEKSGKNRLHIDIHGEPGGLGQLVERLEGQGPPGHWWVMRAPEGNEFCAA